MIKLENVSNLRKMVVMTVFMTSVNIEGATLNDSIIASKQDSINQSDSIRKSVNLKEVVIKAQNVVHHPDKDVWAITDDMRKNTINSFDLLGKIPGFFYDRVDKNISYKGMENVVIIVDGREKDMQYIGELSNMRFKKIEIYEHPQGKFQDYDVVVNLITKEDWEGYDILAENFTVMEPARKYGNLISADNTVLSLTYTRPKYDMAAYYEHWLMDYEQGGSMNMSENNDVFYTFIDENRPNRQYSSDKHTAWLDFDYKISKNHVISAKYNFRYINNSNMTDFLLHKEILSSQQSIELRRVTDNNYDVRDHIATLYYRGKLSRWTLYSDLTFDFYNEHLFYAMNEGWHTTEYYKRNIRRNSIFSLDATDRINEKNSLNIGYQGYCREYESSYERNNVLSSSNFIRQRFYASFTHAFSRKASLKIGGTLEYLSNEAEGVKNHQFSGLGNLLFRYSGLGESPLSTTMQYTCAREIPSLDQSLPNKNWKDSLTYTAGNPLLKASILHLFNLQISKSHAYLKGSFGCSGDKISKVYQWTNNNICETFGNVKYNNYSLTAGYSSSRQVGKGNLSLVVELNYSGNKYWNDELRLSEHHWGTWLRLLYSNNKWGHIQFDYISKPIYNVGLQSINITTLDREKWRITAWQYFFKRRLMVQLSFNLPVDLGVHKYCEVRTETPFYTYHSKRDDYEDLKYGITLYLTYRLSHGHQVKKLSNRQQIQNETNF